MPARARAAPRRLRRSFGPLYTRPRGRRQARRTRVTWRRKSFRQHTAGTRPLPVLRGVASSPHTLTEAPPYARLRTSQIDRTSAALQGRVVTLWRVARGLAVAEVA